MKEAILRFWNDEEGATAIEYGLIAGLISVVLVGVLTSLGGKLDDIFQAISDGLDNAKPSSTTP